MLSLVWELLSSFNRITQDFEPIRRIVVYVFMIRISLILLLFGLSTFKLLAQLSEKWEKDKLFNDSIYPRLKLNPNVPFARDLMEITDWEEIKAEQEKMKVKLQSGHSENGIVNPIPHDTSHWRIYLMSFEEHHGMMLQSQVYSENQWFKAQDSLQPITLKDLRKELEKEGAFHFDPRLYGTVKHEEFQLNTCYFMKVGEVLEIILWGNRKPGQDMEDEGITFNGSYSTWTLCYLFVRP